MSGWWDKNVVAFVTPMALFQTEPVYHKLRPIEERVREIVEDGYMRTTGYTTCGRIAHRWGRGSAQRSATLILLSHAERFGRPCRTCFPIAPPVLVEAPRSEVMSGISG